jgi:hypothetical protein
VALTLIYDITVPVQAETFERAQDAISAAGYDARCVQVLDADEPAAAMVTCIEIASDRSQE